MRLQYLHILHISQGSHLQATQNKFGRFLQKVNLSQEFGAIQVV